MLQKKEAGEGGWGRLGGRGYERARWKELLS
jgi:hypothetical protein